MTTQIQHFVGAVFDNPDDTKVLVEQMIKRDFPIDQVSILHKACGLGDDILGIAYTNEKKRFKVWGAQGTLWSSLGGLYIGTAGLFLLPSIGPVLLAGPVIDTIVDAAVGAERMTTGAESTHLTIALRRIGIPEDKLELLHQAVIDGKTVLLMHCGNDDPEAWHQRMVWKGAAPVFTLP